MNDRISKGLLWVIAIFAGGGLGFAQTVSNATWPPLRILAEPADPKLPSLFLIGASDVSAWSNVQTVNSRGLRGWGELLPKYFDVSKMNVVNRAIGVTARTYLTVGYWKSTLEMMKSGDYLIVAFGPYPEYNEQRPDGMLRGMGDDTREVENFVTKQPEIVRTYGWYVRAFIADAKSRGVIPIVCTNVAIQKWEFGQNYRANEQVDGWLVEIARAAGVSFLPLDEIIARKYDVLGKTKVEGLFGIGEVTHTNTEGADLNAQSVVAALKGLSGSPFSSFFSETAADIQALDLAAFQIEPPKAIEDHEPNIAVQVKRMVEQAQMGAYDASLYTPEAAAAIHKWLATEGGRALKALGELKNIQLTGRDEKDGHRIYRYRMVFESESSTLRLTFSPEGKISQLY